MTKAEQVAGYLKLSSAFFTVDATENDNTLILELRDKLASEMDSETLNLAMEIKWKLGGWYDGDKGYSVARKIERAYAGVVR